MSKRTLYAGPWFGEIGFEFIHWQGYVRKMSRKFDKTIVCSYPGRAPLYQDFANKFIAHKITGEPNENYIRHKKGSEPVVSFDKQIRCPERLVRETLFKPFEDQEFIKFGADDPVKDYKIVFHARNCNRGFRKNQDEFFCKELAGLFDGMQCATIGTSSESLYVHGMDFRDKALDFTMRVLAGAKLIVGVSSGPMHLATLCGCPQVVWGKNGNCRGHHTLEDRYKKLWNPFDTPCEFIHTPEWKNPDLKEVASKAAKLL